MVYTTRAGVSDRPPPVRLPEDRLVPDSSAFSPSNARRRVLVVEDNRDAADSLCMLIGLLGHDCRACYDGPSGLTAARADRPDVLFCDLDMPGGMSGLELAAALRGELPDTQLVAVTGHGRDEDVKRALAAGFDRHLTKPAETDDLLAVLAARR